MYKINHYLLLFVTILLVCGASNASAAKLSELCELSKKPISIYSNGFTNLVDDDISQDIIVSLKPGKKEISYYLKAFTNKDMDIEIVWYIDNEMIESSSYDLNDGINIISTDADIDVITGEQVTVKVLHDSGCLYLSETINVDKEISFDRYKTTHYKSRGRTDIKNQPSLIDYMTEIKLKRIYDHKKPRDKKVTEAMFRNYRSIAKHKDSISLARNIWGDTSVHKASILNDIDTILFLTNKANGGTLTASFYYWNNMELTALDIAKKLDHSNISGIIKRKISQQPAPWAIARPSLQKIEKLDKTPPRVSWARSNNKQHAYPGDTLSFSIRHLDSKGTRIRHRWSLDGKTYLDKKFKITSDLFRTSSTFELPVDKPGKWELSVVGKNGQALYINELNTKIHTIDVYPKKQKETYHRFFAIFPYTSNIKHLIRAWAPLNMIDYLSEEDGNYFIDRRYRKSLIGIAVASDNIRYLYEAKKNGDVDPTARSSDDTTMVVAAMRTGNIEMVKATIDMGFDINQKNEVSSWDRQGFAKGDGNTALYDAVFNRNFKMTSYLLDNGADPNIANKYGYTPLSRATYECQPKLMKSLLTHGAKNIKDKKGKDGNFWIKTKCIDYFKHCDSCGDWPEELLTLPDV